MLKNEQITRAYRRFVRPDWAGWWSAYTEFVAWSTSAPPEELRTEQAQKKLWSARDITPVGPGDSVNVTPLLTDAEVIEALIALRSREWPVDTDARADAIQSGFDQLLGLFPARNLKLMPIARLHRAFVALLPRELTCVLSYSANRNVSDLLLGTRRGPMLAGQVKMRARLRELLGPEKDLAEDVRRATFCWWLHENHHRFKTYPGWEGEVASPGEQASSETGAQPVPPEKAAEKESAGGEDTASSKGDLPDVEASKELTLWPFAKQFMGNFVARNFAGAYRAVAQAALAGLSQDDLVAALQSGGAFDNVAPQSLRSLIVRMKGLGLLEEKESLLWPTEAGDELLENEQPDVLVRLFLERIFGFAQLLRFLEGNPGASDQDTVRALQAIYPNWTSARVPGDLRAWSSYLGLVARNKDGAWVLTEYGAAWAARLPKKLPMPPSEVVVDAAADLPSQPPGDAPPFPSFADILARFHADPEIAGFLFDDADLASLHTAWRSSDRKRFVILSGLSGTGKTAVTLCYSRAVCELLGLPVAEHREVVPVSPDWRDPSGLLGYFNALHAEPTFQAEPALRLVLRAAQDPGRPYFLILDEMNLARVERYFAPFLSAMETGKELVLHANSAAVNDVPPRIPWPANLHIAGTVNMDETTHPFSDKVLDRAFTLEFWEVDLKGYFERRAAKSDAPRLPAVEEVLMDLYDALRPIRRHFGYRAANEVLAFVQAAPLSGGGAEAQFLDRAIFSKVLPRLRGEDTPAFRAALERVGDICKERGLARSAGKVDDMTALLKHSGVSRFWA